MSNKQFFVSLLVNAKCGGGRRPAAGAVAASRRPARRKISHGAIFCVNNPAAGRRETASNVERRPAQCARRRLISLLLLISACYLYRTAQLDGSGVVSVGGVTDGTDRHEYFVVLSEIFACASIEIFRWTLRFAHVNGSGYRIFLRKFAERIFLLWPTDSCKLFGEHRCRCQRRSITARSSPPIFRVSRHRWQWPGSRVPARRLGSPSARVAMDVGRGHVPTMSPLVMSICNQKFGIPRKYQNQIGIWHFSWYFLGILSEFCECCC